MEDEENQTWEARKDIRAARQGVALTPRLFHRRLPHLSIVLIVGQRIVTIGFPSERIGNAETSCVRHAAIIMASSRTPSSTTQRKRDSFPKGNCIPLQPDFYL